MQLTRPPPAAGVPAADAAAGGALPTPAAPPTDTAAVCQAVADDVEVITESGGTEDEAAADFGGGSPESEPEPLTARAARASDDHDEHDNLWRLRATALEGLLAATLDRLIVDTPLDQLHAKLPELRGHLQAALDGLPAPAPPPPPPFNIEAAAVKSLEAVHARRLEAAKLCHELRHLPGLSRTGAFQPLESSTLRGKTLVSGAYKHSLLRVVMRTSTLLEILAEPTHFDVERMNDVGQPRAHPGGLAPTSGTGTAARGPAVLAGEV